MWLFDGESYEYETSVGVGATAAQSAGTKCSFCAFLMRR